ncbi:MAG: hypothetical protein IID37_01135 [Planctomycetes bacterium]|nr:hypothetical protein [Planctomycetota bacterium]
MTPIRRLDELTDKLADVAKQVYVDGDCIVINVVCAYEIPLGACNTPELILGWVTHLCEKNWITREVIHRFVALAAGENGVKIRRSD